MKSKFFILALCAASLVPSWGAERKIQVRLGTLVPSGTSYYKILQEMGDKWSKASQGQVSLTLFGEAKMGGEAAMASRLRLGGQLNAALFSTVGLTEFDDSSAVLQSMPMVYRSWEEVDYVREKLRPDLEKRLEAKGYTVLFWTDGGWVRYFSKQPAVSPNEFRQMKIFTWAGESAASDIMKSLGFKPVSLETRDILVSLNTGMIDAVPTVPFVALSGQFYTTAKHMLEMKWAPLTGAAIIRSQTWKSIPEDLRKEFTKAALQAGEKMRERGRAEDTESIQAMQKRGLTVHALNPQAEKEWHELAEALYPKVKGTIVPADLFDQVVAALADYRKSTQAKP